MTGPPSTSDELNLPAAKAVLALLRLSRSTNARPKGMTFAAMRSAASTYTGRLYQTRHHETMAIQDLERWIKWKEREATQ